MQQVGYAAEDVAASALTAGVPVKFLLLGESRHSLSCSASSSHYHIPALQERYTGDSFVRVLLTVNCIQSDVSARLLACLSHDGLAWDISAPDLLRLQRLVLAQFRWCSLCSIPGCFGRFEHFTIWLTYTLHCFLQPVHASSAAVMKALHTGCNPARKVFAGWTPLVAGH